MTFILGFTTVILRRNHLQTCLAIQAATSTPVVTNAHSAPHPGHWQELAANKHLNSCSKAADGPLVDALRSSSWVINPNKNMWRIPCGWPLKWLIKRVKLLQNNVCIGIWPLAHVFLDGHLQWTCGYHAAFVPVAWNDWPCHQQLFWWLSPQRQFLDMLFEWSWSCQSLSKHQAWACGVKTDTGETTELQSLRWS